MIALTDAEVRDAFNAIVVTNLLPPPLVVEPVSSPRAVPPVADDAGSVVLVESLATAPPLSRVTPPPLPRLDVWRGKTHTFTFDFSAADFELAVVAEHRKPTSRGDWLARWRITPSPGGYVRLFKATWTNNLSGRGALYRPGCVTEDVSGEGLYLAPTVEWARYWMGGQPCNVFEVGVFAHQVTDGSIQWPKARVPLCYTIRQVA